jgi:ATPase subunit of ABC transporter with duplicated ATPase domains
MEKPETPETPEIKVNKYKGMYSEWHKKNYIKKKQQATEEDKLLKKQYLKQYYNENKQNYILRTIAGNEKTKKALKIYKLLGEIEINKLMNLNFTIE